MSSLKHLAGEMLARLDGGDASVEAYRKGLIAQAEEAGRQKAIDEANAARQARVATPLFETPTEDCRKTKARELAKKYIAAWLVAGYGATKQDAALYVEGEFSNLGYTNRRFTFFTAAHIERHFLTGITGRLPGSKLKKTKIPEGKRGGLPEPE